MLPLSTRTDHGAQKFQVQLQIEPVQAGTKNVHYKCDGARFSGTGKQEYSVKLTCETSYILTITSTPPITCTSCKVCHSTTGQDLEQQQQELQAAPQPLTTQLSVDHRAEQPPIPASNLQPQMPGPQAPQLQQGVIEALSEPAPVRSWYAWSWKCDLPISTKSDRSRMHVRLATQELGQVDLPMICKVYKPNDKARLNGSRLRHVQYGLVPDTEAEAGKVVFTSFFDLP